MVQETPYILFLFTDVYLIYLLSPILSLTLSIFLSPSLIPSQPLFLPSSIHLLSKPIEY